MHLEAQAILKTSLAASLFRDHIVGNLEFMLNAPYRAIIPCMLSISFCPDPVVPDNTLFLRYNLCYVEQYPHTQCFGARALACGVAPALEVISPGSIQTYCTVEADLEIDMFKWRTELPTQH